MAMRAPPRITWVEVVLIGVIVGSVVFSAFLGAMR
jgi:hypothetical protein